MSLPIPTFEYELNGAKHEVAHARDLHAYVRSYTQFSGWMKIQIKRHALTHGVDYVRMPVVRSLPNRWWSRTSHQFDYYLSVPAVVRIGTTVINP